MKKGKQILNVLFFLLTIAMSICSVYYFIAYYNQSNRPMMFKFMCYFFLGLYLSYSGFQKIKNKDKVI